MFRRANALLGRPCGPLATRHRPLLDSSNRSEVAMATSAKGPLDFASIRRANLLPMKTTGLRACPRDLGQVPRDYLLRLLVFNQPCPTDTLWELAKADDNCPLDSKKHLKMVLKIASLQGWLLYEKNQTNNNFYAKIHPARAKEAQELLYQHRHELEVAERERVVQEAAEKAETKERQRAALDVAIHMAQQQLINAVVKLQEHSPDLIQKLPCVTNEGGINFHWYDATRASAQQPANDEGKQAAAE